MYECETNILEKETELSDQEKHIIELVTYEMGVMPVGTFKYKVFKYPGDIDIFEGIETCCTFAIAKLTAARKIQNIIQNIINDGDAIFVDFKAGYDLRFKIYTGVVNNSIEDYQPELIRRDINNLYQARLITYEERQLLFSLVNDDPEIDDIVKLNDILRSYWILRWTVEELLQGYKVLRGDYKLYLDTAISQGSIVKLDVISYVDDRYIEVTNFFLISLLDKYGNRVILSEELGDYGQSLLLDVYKYYNSNPLKSIKRLWMYLAFKRQICELSIFAPLFSSDLALYSQIASDVDVAITLLSPNFRSYLSNPDGINSYKLLLDSLRRRLSLLNGLCVNNPQYYPMPTFNIDLFIKNLIILKTCLQDEIKAMVYEWLESNDIDILALAQEF